MPKHIHPTAVVNKSKKTKRSSGDMVPRPIRFSGFSSLIPSRHLVRLVTDYTFVYSLGHLATASYFFVAGNSFETPFGIGAPNVSNTSNNIGYASVSSSVNTQQFPGYTYLTSLYNRYKVHKSSLEAVLSPQSSSDTVKCSIMAQTSPQFVAGGYPLLQNQMANQPAFREKTAVVGCAAHYNKCSTSIESYTALGLTKTEYDCLPPDQVATLPVKEWYWYVQFLSMDAAVTASPVPVTLRLTMDVELSEPIVPYN